MILIILKIHSRFIEHTLSLYHQFQKNFNMSKRITIILDDDLDKKLRLLQAKYISSKKISCSYSKIVNDTLRKGVK